jgi:hypothetical protein
VPAITDRGAAGNRRESLDAPSEHARQPHTGAEHLRLNASVSGALRGTEGSNPSPSSGESSELICAARFEPWTGIFLAMALAAMRRRNTGSSLTVKPRNDRCHGRATALFSVSICSLRRRSMKRVGLATPVPGRPSFGPSSIPSKISRVEGVVGPRGGSDMLLGDAGLPR